MSVFLQWGGRILGVCIVVLCLLLLLGEGGRGPGLSAQSTALYVAMAGLVLGLFKPMPGGVLALAGIGTFYGLDYHYYGRLPGGPVFPLFWVAGTLLVLGSLLHRRRSVGDGLDDSADEESP